MEYLVGMVIQDYQDYPAETVQMELTVSQVNRLIIRTYVIFFTPIQTVLTTQKGMKLFPYLLETPNYDAYTTLVQNLIGCPTLSQEVSAS